MPEDLAVDVAVLPFAYAALEVVEIAKRDDVDPIVAARVHATLSERLGLSQFAEKIYALPREDRWQTMARASLRDDFYAVQAALTAQVLATTDADADAERPGRRRGRPTTRVVVERARATLERHPVRRHRRPGAAVGRAAGDPHHAELGDLAVRGRRSAAASGRA